MSHIKGIPLKALALLAGGAFLLFLSCSGGPDAYAQIDASVSRGAFEEALYHLNDENGKAQKNIYTSKNEVLLYLDRGMIHHYAEFFKNSSGDLEIAEYLIEDLFTKSVTQEISSYLANDNVKDYAGEDYEDLYINVFNSLNYYHNNDLEGALVEIRRLNEKLVVLADKYETATEKVLESNQQLDTAQLQIEASRFSNSALARYLGILFYRGINRPDDARIDYEELQRAYGLAPAVYTNRIPTSVGDELSVPQGLARLNLIAFTGLSPVKEEELIWLPMPFAPPNNMARLALPKMVDRPSKILRVEAVLDSGERMSFELLENMGAVARETFKSRYALTVLKTVARTIIKTTTSAALASAASSKTDEKNRDGLGALIGLLGRIYTEASEQADTRLSRYFPSYAQVAGINLDPGNYTVTANFYGSGGLVYSELKEITVREGTLNLLEFVCLQ